MKIGFFDSGLGGLTVMRAVAKFLPRYEYEFYGDTTNVPYGDKSEEEIFDLTKSGITHLFEQDCCLVIVACNTASCETLRRLQDEWLPSTCPDRTVLGVIIPVIEELCAGGKSRALLLATKRTVSSGKYHFELGKQNRQDVKIEAQAAPELVPCIEAGKHKEAVEVASDYILERVSAIDTVILGCTHYTVLASDLRRRFPDLRFLSQADIIPHKLQTYLNVHPEITNKLGEGGGKNVYMSKAS